MPEPNQFDIVSDRLVADISKLLEIEPTTLIGMQPLSVEQAAKRVLAMKTLEARAAFREQVGMETMKKIAEYIHESRRIGTKPRMFPERRPNG